jgi:hypothetical protein
LAGAAHARPQAPQWARVLRVLTSQPLPTTPSQSALPALQVPTAQAPIAHTAEPSATEQVRPQAPQLPALALRSVSQPSSASPLQSAKPASHVNAQVPVSHDDDAWARVGHALPQRPQWATLVLVLVSHPLAMASSQLPKGAEQREMVQTPSEQPGSPLTVVQTVPQPPQFWSLLWGLTQAPPQQRSPAAQRLSSEQPITHAPAEQRWPVGQCASVTHTSQTRVVTLQ